MPQTTLYHFCGSHFNEKARWALDVKGTPHERHSLLPGPHVATVKRLTGKTEVPVLKVGDEVIAGSAAIIDHLERTCPDPPLYPEDDAQRERALKIQAHFDEDVGPAARLAIFHELLDGRFAAEVFGAESGAAAKTAYRLGFAPIHAVIKKQMGVTQERADDALVTVGEALDFVAKESSATGYLVGERFSVADLACAALLMLTVDVSDVGGPPVPKNEKGDRWLARFADHPGAAWVRDVYRKHRQPAP